MSTQINQSGAAAGGDVVAGNKLVADTINVHAYQAAKYSGLIEALKIKLESEIKNRKQAAERIEQLQRYDRKRAIDGIEGLEAKLTAAGRIDEIDTALERKEEFSKLLEKWSLYLSAQEIFAFLLANADTQFSTFIYPKIGVVDDETINILIFERIVTPTIEVCGASVFRLDPSIVLGMVYWLAEQCFVRWHRPVAS